MDLINDQPSYLIPFISTFIGVISGLHCIGMCGPLLHASARDKKGRVLYHFSRLCGYLSLVLAFSFIKNSVEHFLGDHQDTMINIMLVFMIFLGLGLFYKKKLAQLHFLERPLIFAMRRRVKSIRSVLVGYFSVLLPCGVLYGLIFAFLALDNLLIALLSTIGFWLGTVFTLVIGGAFIRKLFAPFSSRLPKLTGVLIICIALGGLIQRSYALGTKKVSAKGKQYSCH